MPSDLERRLEASLVLLTLRVQAPLHIDRLAEKTGLTRQQVGHDLTWLRFVAGCDIQIVDRIVSLRA